MNDELKWCWKEAVVAQFKVLFRLLPVTTEENHKNSVIITGLWA
jgi:hypothetical protein